MARPARPDPVLVAGVRQLIDATSLAEAGRRLHLADATTARLAAGLPVTEGTVLVVEKRLRELEGQS
jgi:hypothetical protein